MKTTYHVYRPGVAEPETFDVDWPDDPGYDKLKALIEPLLGERENLEHVTVLHNDARADMFVSDEGKMAQTWRDPLPRNDAATAIYRRNWMTQHPGGDPEKLPMIVGVAVLFDRIVWY